MRTAAFVAALASLSATAFAQANATALATIDAQYKASGLNLGGNAGFGIELQSTALLTVTYGFGAVTNGETYSNTSVAEQPSISVTPADAATFNSSSRYTLTLADASSLGDPDTEGNYRHFLANSLTGVAPTSGNQSFSPTGGQTITYYAAPGPLPGTGPHRYAWLLFEQPADFAAPSNLSSTTGSSHWYVSDYVRQTGIQLVAASFFIVENGTPTGSVAPTTAVNTASVAASASASVSKSSSKGSSSSASSAAPSASASGNTSGAGKAVASAAGLLAGVFGVALLA